MEDTTSTIEEGGLRANEKKREGPITPSWRRERWEDVEVTCGVKGKSHHKDVCFLLGEQDAMRDLDKPIPQLLADIHEQQFKADATQLGHVLEAVRRTASMFAQVTLGSRKVEAELLAMNKRLLNLTEKLERHSRILVGVGVVSCAVAVIAILVAVFRPS